jgi:putative toxin-antitoxin system antitoxin component (TIGR02293 family)
MYGASIGLRPRDLNDLIGILKQGLPVEAFDRLRDLLDVPEKMLASTVNIAYRTLGRRKKEGRLKTDESERVLRIAKLYEKALDVLEDAELAQQALSSRQRLWVVCHHCNTLILSQVHKRLKIFYVGLNTGCFLNEPCLAAY